MDGELGQGVLRTPVAFYRVLVLDCGFLPFFFLHMNDCNNIKNNSTVSVDQNSYKTQEKEFLQNRKEGAKKSWFD